MFALSELAIYRFTIYRIIYRNPCRLGLTGGKGRPRLQESPKLEGNIEIRRESRERKVIWHGENPTCVRGMGSQHIKLSPPTFYTLSTGITGPGYLTMCPK